MKGWHYFVVLKVFTDGTAENDLSIEKVKRVIFFVWFDSSLHNKKKESCIYCLIRNSFAKNEVFVLLDKTVAMVDWDDGGRGCCR